MGRSKPDVTPYIRKLLSGLSVTALIAYLTISALSGCRQASKASAVDAAVTGQMQAAVSTPVKLKDEPLGESEPPTEDKSSVAIESAAVYGWWWSDEQLEHDFDADNPPPKSAYIRLDKWDASQPDSPHPDRVDLVCYLKNHSDHPAELSVEAFAAFKVASYESIAWGAGTQRAVDEKLSNVQWSATQKVTRLDVGTLQPNEVKEVRLKNFHLRSIINKYFQPDAGDLWPWKLRVSVIAKDLKGAVAASAMVTIDLIPGD